MELFFFDIKSDYAELFIFGYYFDIVRPAQALHIKLFEE